MLDAIVRMVRAAPALLGPHGGEPAPVRLVAVDGPAGSGKTTLAAQLATALGAQVVHMDDLYEGWSGLADVDTLLLEHVIQPMAAGGAGRYQRYDWELGRRAEWHDVPRAEVVVIEGCGSAPRAISAWLSMLVWVEADDDIRLARGLARDGESFEPLWRAFMRSEREVFARERTRERADLRLDGCGRITS